MKERGPDPLALDVLALCKADGALEGVWPLAALPRLGESFCAASDGSAHWQPRGWLQPVIGGEPEIWLELQGSAEVPLQCQRCLQPIHQRLRAQRRFRFVRTEDEAARLDEDSEDDVLALPARLDLQALLEDELILALPIVARHDVCPDPLPLPADDELEGESPAANPFAALAALRGRLPDGD